MGVLEDERAHGALQLLPHLAWQVSFIEGFIFVLTLVVCLPVNDSLLMTAAKTSPSNIFKELQESASAPFAILFQCKDEIRFRRALEILKRHPDLVSAEEQRFRAADITPLTLVELSDAARSIGLFSSKKLFILEGVEALPLATEKSLLALCTKPIEGVHFFIWARSLNPSSGWRKLESTTLRTIELAPLKGHDLRRWTEKELRSQSIVQFTNDVVEPLIDLCNELPDLIVARIEQLATYLDDEPCTRETLAALFPEHLAPDDFALIGLMNRKDSLRAILQVDEMLRDGRNPFPTIALLAKSLLNYAVMQRALESGVPQGELRQGMNVPPWLFQKQLDGARSYRARELSRIAHQILRTDSKLKGRSLGPEQVLFDFVLDIAGRNDWKSSARV